MANVLGILAKYRKYLIGLALVLIGILCLWIRLNPLTNLQTLAGGDPLNLSASDDPLYNFRQVELIIHNFPNYPWFDPMTLYPFGQVIYWGPLFPTIAAVVCMAVGATTRPGIVFVAQLIPPAMAALMVPIVFLIGRRMADWKTGLLAAFFAAIIPGQYLQRSLFGYFDHHIAEVLFSSLFCLGYIAILVYTKRNPVDFGKMESLKDPAILSLLTGFAYLLGLYNMPTMILFALIVAAFTVVQYVWDFFRRRSSDYLLLANTIIFAVAIVGLLAFGIKPGLDLSVYTIGHIYAYVMIIVGTGLLALHARYLKGRPWYQYPLSLAGIGIAVVLFLALVLPTLYSTLIASLFQFFGQPATALTVQEARGWDPLLAWMTFQYGLVLMPLGMLAMVYRNWREEHPDQIFVLVWSFIVLYSTIQHIRYEYYLAINIALLSAFAAGTALDQGLGPARAFIARRRQQPVSEPEEKARPKEERHGKKAKRATGKEREKERRQARISTSPWVIVLAAVVALIVLFTYNSLQYDQLYSQGTIMNGDWRESLEWMGTHTPDPGLNYYGIYSQAGFKYPPTAYGVISWWDYGHQITFIAKRIPNANPFQAGVAGPTGVAQFFVSQDEAYADGVADAIGTRYVVTDIEMDSPKFWAMATWFNSSAGDAPYNPGFYVPSDTSGHYQLVKLNTQAYYDTMISRLHNFDGSMTAPGKVYYIEAQTPDLAGLDAPLITNAVMLDAGDAKNRSIAYNANAAKGNFAAVVSQAVFLPVDTVPALQHYRLIHESPSGVYPNTSAGAPDLKYVKVFEYVKGAHIKGQGIIDLDLVTNTGRTFTYRQQSVNGEFVVPYSTQGNPYTDGGVQALGKYQIEGTGLTYDVPESAVMQGTTI
ncbi:MAG TPA: oligosaccharyl transferase, archaeosortase A system-associated [Methanomicrobiales archaeon]|nr:oligosaccharyl transferase, archaeosortase A system-associated [Methanomicrobiales archaeon]